MGLLNKDAKSLDEFIVLIHRNPMTDTNIKGFKDRLDWFKKRLANDFPEHSLSEIIKMYKYFSTFSDIFSIMDHSELLAAIEYELLKS